MALAGAADRAEALHRAQEHARRLAAVYRAARAQEVPPEVVEVATGVLAVDRSLTELRRHARHTIRSLGAPPEPVPRPVIALCVYDQRSVHEGTLPQIEQFVREGQQPRVVPEVPVRLWIADDHLALVPDGPHRAVLVHPGALLDALRALFDLVWRRAIPLDLPTAAMPRRNRSDRQRLVALLLSGLTDEAIARHLDVGERTAQRRVAALMAELGARTRFQAGVRAAVTDRRPPR